MYGTKSTVTKGLFVETGTYNDVVARPYVTDLDTHTLHRFQEATQGGHSLSASTLSTVAGSMLRPAAQGQGIVGIAQGWDQPRLRFMLEVRHVTAVGQELIQYLTGHTNYIGVVQNINGQAVDQNMELTFNNSITVRLVSEHTPMGMIQRATVAEAAHLLTGQYNPGFGGAGQVTHTMMPEDLFCTWGLGVLSGSDVLDTRTTFAAGPYKKSNRNNSSAPSYLSKTFQANKQAMDMDITGGSDISSLMDSGRGIVMEGLVGDDLFLSPLIRNERTSLSRGSTITYGELCSLDPTLDSRVTVSLRQPGVVDTHQRGQTEYWTSAQTEAVASTVLKHSVPSLMMDLMLTGVHFMATNKTLDGSYHVSVLGSETFAEGVDMGPYLEQFKVRLVHEVLRSLTSNNYITFDLTMSVDILGETYIDISMNDGPKVPFCSPTFCDALFAPVITQQKGAIATMANDIQTLMENLSVPHINQHANGVPSNGYTSSI